MAGRDQYTMPFDIAQTDQMLNGSYRQTFAWKVNLKFCRQSRQTKKSEKPMFFQGVQRAPDLD